jgi:hypothetical protein
VADFRLTEQLLACYNKDSYTKGAERIMKTSTEYARICANCEHAARIDREDEDAFFCHRKKKNVAPDARCRRFFYDLLKHSPSKPREIPTLDPELANL